MNRHKLLSSFIFATTVLWGLTVANKSAQASKAFEFKTISVDQISNATELGLAITELSLDNQLVDQIPDTSLSIDFTAPATELIDSSAEFAPQAKKTPEPSLVLGLGILGFMFGRKKKDDEFN